MSGEVREVSLRIGQFYFGSGYIKIRTLLGSCVSIVMWHPRLRVGGMCHYLLPRRGSCGIAIAAPEGNYAEGAMELFMHELRNNGTRPSEYIVKLFGGGCMFVDSKDSQRPFSDIAALRTDVREISTRNVVAGKELLSKHGFNISAENTGGVGSRTVVFELWSGDVWIRRGNALGTNGTPA
ncbi:MAG: chemotaxis protein CheD [Steroidobacter sp.]